MLSNYKVPHRVCESTGSCRGIKNTYTFPVHNLPPFDPSDCFEFVFIGELIEQKVVLNENFFIVQSKTTNRLVKWTLRNDFLFIRGEDHDIEGYLYQVKYTDVPGIIAMFSRYYELDKRNIGKEFLRQANYIKNILIPKFILDDADLLCIKQFLINYSAFGAFQIVGNREPIDSVYVRHPRLRLDKPNIKLFNIRTMGRRDSLFVKPAIEKSANYNFLKILVDKSKNKYDMDPIKLRKVINSMIKLGKSIEDIKSWINERCFCFKTKEDLEDSHYLWFRRYLDLEYLTYTINDENRFLDSLRAMLKILKSKILDFAQMQWDYHLLTNKEKTMLKEQKRVDFNKILFSPSIQQLYLQGYTHQEIVDFIYIDKSGNYDSYDILGLHKQKRLTSKRGRTDVINKNRDLKFTIQSKPGSLATFDLGDNSISSGVDSFRAQHESLNHTGVYPNGDDWSQRRYDLNDYNRSCADTIDSDDSWTYASSFFPGPDREAQKKYFEFFRNITIIRELVKGGYLTFIGVIGLIEFLRFTLVYLVTLILMTIVLICTKTTLVSETCLYYWNCFKDFVNTTSSVRNTALKTHRAMTNAKRYLTDPDLKLDPDTKLIMVEVKSLLHAMYHLCNKDYVGTAEWLSNALCTRPDEIKSFFVKFASLQTNRNRLDNSAREAHIEIVFQEVVYNIPILRYGEFARAYDAIPEDLPEMKIYILKKYRDIIIPETGSLEDMTAYIMTLTSWFEKYSIPMVNKMDMRNLNGYFLLYSNMKRAGADVLSLSKYVFSFICRSFFAWDPNDSAFSEVVISMLTVIKLTDELIVTQSQLAARRDLIDKTIALYYVAIDLNKKAVLAQVPQFLQRLYFKRFSDLENMTKLAIGYRQGIKERKEPLCILFTGPPCTGKSGTCKFLQKALSFLDDQTWDTVMTYDFSSKDQFWEGYAQQKFVVMDDMFQTIDMTMRGHQATSIIHMVNTAPFNLPMAFDSKGQAFFNSDYILSSTNLCNHGFKKTTFSDVGLQDPEALKRRFGLVLYRDEKISGKIDIAKLKWRVDKCALYPNYEGKMLTSAQVAKLAHLVKGENDRILSNSDYTNDDLSNILADCDLGDSLIEPVIIPRNEEVKVDDDISVMSMPMGFHLESKPNTIPEDNLLTKSGWSRYTLESLKSRFSSWFDDAKKTFEDDYFKHVFGYHYENATDRVSKLDNITLIVTSLSAIGLVIGGIGYLNGFSNSVTDHVNKDKFEVVNTENAVDNNFESQTFEKTATVKLNDRGRIIKNPNVVNGRKYIDAPKVSYGNMQITVESSQNNYLSCVHNSIYKGLLFINAYTDVDGERIIESCVGFHIRDSYVAVPAHCFYKFDGHDARMKICIDKAGYDIPFPDNALRVDGLDMVIFKLPNNIQRPRDLYRFFTDSTNPLPVPEDFGLDILSLTDSGGLSIIHGTKSSNSLPVNYESCDSLFTIRVPLTYRAVTQSGNSGSLVCAQLQSGQVELLGMHVGAYIGSATSHQGVAIPLCKQFLDELIGYCTPKVETVVDEVKFVPSSKTITEFPLVCVKKLNSTEYSRVNRKTEYFRSPIYGWNGPAIKRPAQLKSVNKDGVLLDPLYIALSKFDQNKREPMDIPDHTWDYLHNLYGDGGGSILSWDEVLNGNGGFIRSICHGTSPGYPWNKESGKGKGKSAFIKNDGNRFVFEDFFFEKMKHYESQLLSGNQIEVYWADCLKDELRLNEKVDDLKTRVFSTSPLHYSLLIKKYYGAFSSHLKSKHLTHPVSVGINPHSVSWTILYNRLFSKAGSVIAGDSSKFDANVPSNLVLGINNFINNWYDDGPINRRVRDLLIQHIVEAYHVCQDNMYVIRNSNPSGNAITSELNSLVEMLETYIVLTEDLRLSTFDFDMVVYGDDNVIAINKPGIRVSHLAPHYKRRFNIEYTHFSKDAVDRDDTLETVEYLGRKFVTTGSFVRAPLKFEIITQATYWLHNKSKDVIYETMSAMFLELSHYGRDIYIETTDKFLEYIRVNQPQMYEAACHKRHTYHEYYSGMYINDKFRDFWNGW